MKQTLSPFPTVYNAQDPPKQCFPRHDKRNDSSHCVECEKNKSRLVAIMCSCGDFDKRKRSVGDVPHLSTHVRSDVSELRCLRADRRLTLIDAVRETTVY